MVTTTDFHSKAFQLLWKGMEACDGFLWILTALFKINQSFHVCHGYLCKGRWQPCRDEAPKSLWKTEINSSDGPGYLSSSFVRYRGVPLADTLATTSLDQYSIPDPCRIVNTFPILKSTNFTSLDKPTYPIAIKPSNLDWKKAQRVRACVSFWILLSTLELTYKTSKFTFHVAVLCIHRIFEPSVVKMKSVCCAFLDWLAAFDFAVRPFLLQKLRTFGCPGDYYHDCLFILLAKLSAHDWVVKGQNCRLTVEACLQCYAPAACWFCVHQWFFSQLPLFSTYACRSCCCPSGRLK